MKFKVFFKTALCFLLVISLCLTVSCNKNNVNSDGESTAQNSSEITSAEQNGGVENTPTDTASGNNSQSANNSSDKGSTNISSTDTSTGVIKPPSDDNIAAGTHDADFHTYNKWTMTSNTKCSSKCLFCEEVAELEHVWNDGDITAAPTASSNGVVTYTCQLCAHKKTEAITYTQAYGSEYSTARKTSEKYNAADTEFKIYGASSAGSDNGYSALYGECPKGLAVVLQNERGCYAVNSTNGCFGMRISTMKESKGLFTLWYNGKCVGEIKKDIKLQSSPYAYDAEWRPMIGNNNQGYFYKMLQYFTNEVQITSSNSQKYAQKFSDRIQKLRQVNSGAEIVCVLVPSSITVYPESVPSDYTKLNKTSYYDQVANCLKSAGATVLDLRQTFNEHKNDSLPLYNKYDSHWTDYGAYIAYVELYKHISNKFPSAAPRKLNEFKWTRDYYIGSDIPSYFGVDTKPGTKVLEYGVRRDFQTNVSSVIQGISRYKLSNCVTYDSYTDEMKNEKRYNTGNASLPNVWVMRNSFGTQIHDLIADRSNISHFSTMFTYTFDSKIYSQVKPDYVIYVISEWQFKYILEN